jgi:hypothetical protein
MSTKTTFLEKIIVDNLLDIFSKLHVQQRFIILLKSRNLESDAEQFERWRKISCLRSEGKVSACS